MSTFHSESLDWRHISASTVTNNCRIAKIAANDHKTVHSSQNRRSNHIKI